MTTITTFYRLDVYDPLGIFRHSLTLDEQGLTTVLNLVGGPGLEIAPLGICREATFQGDPATLGILPRDWVDVMYSTDGLTWKARYSGVAAQSANTDSLDPGPYKLVGGLLRLNEVEARKPLAQGDVGVQVRQAIEDARASGQLGSTIAAASKDRIPDVGGDPNGRVLPRYKNVGPLVTSTLVGQRQGLVFGVNATREVVFGVPSGTITLDELDGVIFDDTATNAEVLVTDVRVFWNQVMSGTISTQAGSGRQAVSTYLQDTQSSVAAFAVNLGDHTYGEAWEKLALVVDSAFFTRLAAGSQVDVSVVSTLVNTGSSGGPVLTASGSETTFWDGDRSTAATFTSSGSGVVGQFSITLHYPAGTSPPVGVEWAADNGNLVRLGLQDNARQLGGLTVTNPGGSGGYLLFPSEVTDYLASIWGRPFDLTFVVAFQDSSKPVYVRAGCLLAPSKDDLVAEARTMLRLPALNPTKATVRDTDTLRAWDLDTAAGMGELVRRWPDGSERSRLTRPISLYRFQVSDEGEYLVEVAIGEADDPEESAKAAIIARRAREATVSAVMAS